MGALKKLKFPSGHSVLEIQVNQPDGRSLALPITFIGMEQGVSWSLPPPSQS